MVKKILYVILSCVGVLNLQAQSSGLLFNSGSRIATANGAIIKCDSVNNQGYIYLNDNAILETSDIVNSDTLHTDNASMLRILNDYKAETGGTVLSLNSSLVELSGDWNNAVGQMYQTNDGVFSLVGTDQDIAHTSDPNLESWYGTFVIEGGGVKNSFHSMYCTDLLLNDGILAPNAQTDSIIVLTNAPLVPGSQSSHVRDNLFLVIPETYTFNTVIAPVGAFYAGADHFAPVHFVNYSSLGTDTSIFRVRAVPGPLATPQLNGEILSLYDDNYWTIQDYGLGNHAPFQVRLYADAASVGSAESDWLVAESNSDIANSIFFSLGSSDFGIGGGSPSYVTSNFDGSDLYYAIGTKCNTAKLAVNAQLQAATTPEPDYQSYLDTLYIQGGAVNGFNSTEQMYAGSDIDPNTIDLVKVVLRDPSNSYAIVDTNYAWLLGDNSIVDFKTASTNYLEFCPTPGKVQLGNSYSVELEHRNHLKVITGAASNWTASSVVPTTAETIDFTLPSSHYSLYGYYPGAVAELVAGEANDNITFPGSVDRIDATDVFLTRWRMTELPTTGYSREDANLDGRVNVNDYNIVVPNARAIRRTVLPY